MANGNVHGSAVRANQVNDQESSQSSTEYQRWFDDPRSASSSGSLDSQVERSTRGVSAIAAIADIHDIQIQLLSLVPKLSSDMSVHYNVLRSSMLRKAYNLLDVLTELIHDSTSKEYMVPENAGKYDICMELVIQLIGTNSCSTLEAAHLIASEAGIQL